MSRELNLEILNIALYAEENWRNNYDKTLPIYDDIKSTGRSDRSVRNPWMYRDSRHKMWRRKLCDLE